MCVSVSDQVHNVLEVGVFVSLCVCVWASECVCATMYPGAGGGGDLTFEIRRISDEPPEGIKR